MPGKTIGIMMNAGYAGTQSRTADAIIQNRIAEGAIAFGQAVLINGNQQVEAGGYRHYCRSGRWHRRP